MSKISKIRAFSLIELLVAVAIFILLMTVALSSLNLIKKDRQLLSFGDSILNTLRLAQNKTLASEGARSYGVHFEEKKFVLFEGNSYLPSSPENQEFNLAQGVIIGAINLGGSSDVIFERLSGNASSSGSLVVELEEDASKNKIIYIDPSGTMGFSPISSLDEDRLADSRRVRFIYSQNTRNAATLSFYFPENNYTYEIDYQAGLDAGKTVFNWQGTVEVGGQAQVLQIHSLDLSDWATLFCVHRDRRYNNKALEIFLDGQNLIDYLADGQASQGSSVWAGEPQLQ